MYALRHIIKRCEEAGEKPTPLTLLEKLAFRFYNAYSAPATSCEIREGYDDKSEEQIQNPQELENVSSPRSINHESPARSLKSSSSHRDYSPSTPEKTLLFHLLHCLGHPSLLIQVPLVILVAIPVVGKKYLQKK